MSYYRNYRKPYYYHRRPYRRYRNYGYPLDPLKGIFAIGVAFILLSSLSSITSGHLGNVLLYIILWAAIIALVIFPIRKFKNRSARSTLGTVGASTQSSQKDVAVINSEKHGCKCYMDGLTDGEREIAHILSEELSYKDYFIFNNLTIPSDHNGSSQIDHLVVSRFGVFVIESKDYQGWIFGSRDQDSWTQSLSGGKKNFVSESYPPELVSHHVAPNTHAVHSRKCLPKYCGLHGFLRDQDSTH